MNIEQMAREAGVMLLLLEPDEDMLRIERFAALVRAQALEDAARECRELGNEYQKDERLRIRTVAQTCEKLILLLKESPDSKPLP